MQLVQEVQAFPKVKCLDSVFGGRLLRFLGSHLLFFCWTWKKKITLASHTNHSTQHYLRMLSTQHLHSH